MEQRKSKIADDAISRVPQYALFRLTSLTEEKQGLEQGGLRYHSALAPGQSGILHRLELPPQYHVEWIVSRQVDTSLH